MAQTSVPGDTQPIAPVDLLQEDRDVSPEERARILTQIEQVVAEGRIPVTPEDLSPRSKKSGVLFPVLINLAAAVLVGAGVLALFSYYHSQRKTLALSRGTFSSAEGRLLETYQKQSESLLQAKEEQISRARERLRSVESTFAERLQAREQELRQAMDAELAAERQRLRAQGGADAEVERRLRELQAQRQAASAAELARYQKELELERLLKEREQERLFSDQIRGAYSLVLRDLQANDFPAARRGLQALKALLNDPSLLTPGLKDRRTVDLFLAEALTELVERRSREASGSPASLEPAAAPAAAEAAPAQSAAAAVPPQPPLLAADTELADKLRRAERDLGERERQYQELSRQLRARTAEAEAAQAKSARALEELRQSNERLSAQLEAGAGAERELARQARTAEERALRQGRETALKEVIAFLDYLSQSSAQKKESQPQLLAQARQDPLYAAVIREIQILAAGSRLAGASTSGGYRLLGTVSSLGAGRVAVEPLVQINVKPGARVQIRRVSDLATEQVIARGIVQQAGAGKITILLDTSAKGPLSPAVSDAVYVESQAGE
jgi:hypothetical protein